MAVVFSLFLLVLSTFIWQFWTAATKSGKMNKANKSLNKNKPKAKAQGQNDSFGAVFGVGFNSSGDYGGQE